MPFELRRHRCFIEFADDIYALSMMPLFMSFVDAAEYLRRFIGSFIHSHIAMPIIDFVEPRPVFLRLIAACHCRFVSTSSDCLSRRSATAARIGDLPMMTSLARQNRLFDATSFGRLWSLFLYFSLISARAGSFVFPAAGDFLFIYAAILR